MWVKFNKKNEYQMIVKQKSKTLLVKCWINVFHCVAKLHKIVFQLALMLTQSVMKVIYAKLNVAYAKFCECIVTC